MLFVCGAARVNSIRDDTGRQLGALGSGLRVGSLIVHAIGSKLLALIEDAYFYLHKALQIIIMRRNTCHLARSCGSRFES
jgi:hypothetical protein